MGKVHGSAAAGTKAGGKSRDHGNGEKEEEEESGIVVDAPPVNGFDSFMMY